jgi:hypothetical protein
MDNEKFQELVLKKLELLDTLTNDITGLTSKVDKIDANQVRLETEITEKIRALFDFRQVSLDYFTSIKDSLARIEANQESFRHILYNVESKQREQDRELRLLHIEEK